MDQTKDWYDNSYSTRGFNAQRRYPNEELLRFLGGHYFHLDASQRASAKILEVGCGSGANLWMIAREGFEAYGLDLSRDGLTLCEEMLQKWNTQAELRVGSMTSLPYPPAMFDAIVDVFSSYCLNEIEFGQFLDGAARVLKPGGRLFSFAPSKRSDSFLNYRPAEKKDPSSLSGIHRKTSPYYGNFYLFRFISSEEYETKLAERGFAVTSSEHVGRTYRHGEEYFEFVSIAAQKQ